MVHHVVLFRFRRDLPEAAVEAIFQELRGFRQSLPGITGFQGGAYNSPEGLAKGFTHGFTMTFADAAARDAYLPHPLHQAVVKRLLPMLEGGIDGVLTFDFIDGVMAPPGCLSPSSRPDSSPAATIRSRPPRGPD
ncbi:MAG: Dabb family protein [Synechococcaceae cyanobacterium]|jgi:hypothetical protein